MTKTYNKIEVKAKRKKLRNNMPNAEKKLWNFLRSKQLNGVKFRRQYSIGSYIVDFYSPRYKLAIEVDGDSHFIGSAPIYDLKRENYIKNIGVQILRFSNLEIYNNIQEVLENISTSLKRPLLASPYKGEE